MNFSGSTKAAGGERVAPPRVSVVINVWNGERYLEAALNSVFAQEFRDFELVVVDDASTDQSPAILAAIRDPRLRVVRLETRIPLGQARNLAVQQTVGEWIAWLDQDDLWIPSKLRDQVALIDGDRGSDLGLVYGRTLLLKGGVDGPDAAPQFEYSMLPEGLVHRELLEHGDFIPMSSSMVRRAAFDSVSGIPSRYEVAVDYWLYAAVARTWRARALQDVCCWYRLHDDNMTWSYGFRAYEEAHEVVLEFAAALPPPILRKRLAVWQTLMSVEQALTPGRRSEALRRLLSKGSPLYLASRPFARAWRGLKRALSGGSPASVRFRRTTSAAVSATSPCSRPA